MRRMKYVYGSLLSLVVFAACTSDPLENESVNQEAANAAQNVQEEQEKYPDSVLSKVLAEELDFLKEKDGTTLFKNDQGMRIVKDNPKPVYVHYMPWFQSLEVDGYWGQHWTMSNRDPNIVDDNGKRQIAAHYYPTIGPYSSVDPDLQEYHFLLMKMAGIDGVIFDWYGSRNIHDYNLIKTATESFMDRLADIDLDFMIMYEDRVATMSYSESALTTEQIIANGVSDFEYIRDMYFTKPNYGEYNGSKILSVFGPHHIFGENHWNQLLSVFDTAGSTKFLSLWGAHDIIGERAAGEFLWVDPNHIQTHEDYYEYSSIGNEIVVGGVYPGFNSYYVEGGWSEGINTWTIDRNNTFEDMLSLSHHEIADFMQVITWNDFGEGTMIEPTLEFGFDNLTTLQEYTGVSFTEEDMQAVVRLYNARKDYANNDEVQNLLNRTYNYAKRLDFNRVDQLLSAVTRFYTVEKTAR